MTTHTPGPWCFRKDIVYGGPDEDPVCVMNYELTPEIMAANARLIAKAPELLAALRDVMLWYATTTDGDMDASLFDRAHDAILRATGEQA